MAAKAWALLCIVLAGCAAPTVPVDIAPPPGILDGIVVNALLQPIPGATVRVLGGEPHAAPVHEDGRYAIHANWTLGEHIVVFEAPGYESATRTFTAHAQSQHISFNVTLAKIPLGGLDTQSYRGLISCAAIVQVGHDHGSGDPEEDRHVACEVAGRDVNEFQLRPQPDVQDLLLELFWDANSDLSKRMTLVLRNETGAVVGFDEGTSPLRVFFGRSQITNLFADGQIATIQVLPGVSEDAPADLFVGVHIEQPFELFATTGHGMDVPLHWTVAE